MSHALIYSWLKLAPEPWPPDHYTLLGLRPGEADSGRIEQQVHLRMEWVRGYQLAHPELVTEAMNCLARAYDCLSNPESKKAYDGQLNLKPAAPAAAQDTPPVAAPAGKAAAGPDKVKPLEPPPAAPGPAAKPAVLQWAPELAPAPRSPAAAPQPEAGRATLELKPDRTTTEATEGPPAAAPAPGVSDLRSPVAYAPGSPAADADDPALAAARSTPARRGLGTKRALYLRISKTRRLIRAWAQAEKYLGHADSKLADRATAIDLVRQLTIIRQQLHDYPPILGQAGQAGYLVVALARQPFIVQTYQALLPSQRQAYVRDWEGGLSLLAAYRLFLREELSSLRRKGWLGRLQRAGRAFAHDYPALWVLLLALVPANLAFPGLRAFWPLEVLGGAGGLALLFFYQGASRRQSLHRLRHPPAKTPLK